MSTETHELTFRLLHVALYAKGHYKRTGDIFADLKLCLQKDDYTPFTDEDVLGILTRHIPNFIFRGRDAGWVITEVRDACHPKLCWKRGYSHADDYRNQKERKRDGELRNQPYNFDKALVHFYMSELCMTDMKVLGLAELPEPCIPELYKEHVTYCKIVVTPPHNVATSHCPVAYNDFGMLVSFNDSMLMLPDYEPQHIHFCAGESKQGEMAYSASQDIIGMNGDSFDSSNRKCIASTEYFKNPWNVLSLPQAFIDVFVKLRGKIEEVDIVSNKENEPMISDENGRKVVVIGAECWKYLQAQVKEVEQKELV